MRNYAQSAAPSIARTALPFCANLGAVRARSLLLKFTRTNFSASAKVDRDTSGSTTGAVPKVGGAPAGRSVGRLSCRAARTRQADTCTSQKSPARSCHVSPHLGNLLRRSYVRVVPGRVIEHKPTHNPARLSGSYLDMCSTASPRVMASHGQTRKNALRPPDDRSCR
jgi:hypothetical protein